MVNESPSRDLHRSRGLTPFSRPLASLHALEAVGLKKIAPARDAILALPATGTAPDNRYSPYVPRILEKLRADLGVTAAPAAETKKGKRKAAK